MVMLAYQKKYPKHRIWNQPTGYAYMIDSVKAALKLAFMGKMTEAKKRLRMIFFGNIGCADISGLTDEGIRIEIEIKVGNDRQRKEQKTFEEMIKKLNGIYKLVDDKSPIEDQI